MLRRVRHKSSCDDGSDTTVALGSAVLVGVAGLSENQIFHPRDSITPWQELPQSPSRVAVDFRIQQMGSVVLAW